jgi:hypothetical protein
MNRMFTVILLRPDYMADPSTPADTYLAHVMAKDSNDAIDEAQAEAWRDDERHLDDMGDCTDYYPIAVFSGHLEDVK